MLHIYRNFNIPNDKYYPPEYIDCDTGEIYSWERVKELKLSGLSVYYHRSFKTFWDYMNLSVLKYNHFGTPIIYL